jgi:type IV secretion system protein VirB4
MYIFHKIELRARLALSPIMIFFDEGWFFLRDPLFAKWFEERLPTFRKNNAFIILATQSASSILDCSIADKYLDNAATGILAPNDKANWEIYKQLNISYAEFQFIKNTPKSLRKALYKQDHRSAIIQFNLSGFDKELAIFSTNTATYKKITQLIDTHGDHPDHWLNQFYSDMGLKADV